MKAKVDTPGAVALVGSGEYLPQMDDVDRALLATLGDRALPLVALLPTASAIEPGMPERWNALGVAHFRALGVAVAPLLVLRRDDAHDPAILANLEQASFFYFSGGNPLHIVTTWRDTPAWEILQSRWRSGAILAGCSAGAMMMGAITIDIQRLRRGALLEWVPALGVLPDLAALPHFDRLRARLTQDQLDVLLGQLPSGVTVVGVDEDTALVRFGTQWQVLGRQGVSVFGQDRREIRYTAGERVPLAGIDA